MGVLSFVSRLRFLRSEPHGIQGVNEGCAEFEVDNWIISSFVLQKLVPAVGVHPFPLNELMLMVSAVCRLKPTHVFEWGTNVGKSARVFYETCKYFDLDTEIHSTDLPEDAGHPEHPGAERGTLVKGRANVHLHAGDGLERSLGIYSGLDRDIVKPLFFVDGDHSYASVKRELEGIIRCVPQPWILVHDTFFQSEESGYNVGPWQAIQDTLSCVPGKFRLFSQELGLPGMTLLRPVDRGGEEA